MTTNVIIKCYRIWHIGTTCQLLCTCSVEWQRKLVFVVTAL